MKQTKKELRSKFMQPILFLSIIMSSAIFILFNVVLFYMLDISIRNSLHFVSTGLKQVAPSTPPEKLRAYFDDFAINTSAFGSINLVINEQNGNPVFMYDAVDQTVLDALNEYYSDSRDGTHIVPIENTKYYVTHFTLNEQLPDAYLILSGQSSYAVMKSCNRALGIILICATALFAVVLHGIATRISLPIQSISRHADSVGNGKLEAVTLQADTVEVQMLADSLNRMVGKLKMQEDAQKISLQNLSHELRTPLMSIQGYAEGIKYDVVDDKASAAGIIIEESQRLNQIVDRIIMLSRLDTANQPLRMVNLQLSDFLEEVVAQIGGYAMKQEKNLKNLVTDPMLFVRADAQLLGVVINNIVTNALRYAKSKVEISAQGKGDAILLTICDDGCGFSQADFDHLFERFYKGESGNFGLGMSIAKSSVEYMQGRIEAFNNQEGGATVRLTLPKK